MALFGWKIKPLKILGNVVKAAAPVALSLAGGPASVAVVGGSSGLAALTKLLGKKAEKAGAGRPHKVVTPLAALTLPAGLEWLAGLLGVDGSLDHVTALLAQFGIEGVPAWLVVGLLLWLSHQSGHNVQRIGNQKVET